MQKTRIAIVGLGKIARDQHIPSLAASEAFDLVAVASPHHALDGVPSFTSIEALFDAVPDVAAVSLCTTPQVRYHIARLALQNGCHVLLEKPPGVTVSEVQALAGLARRRGVVLFASWHSRFAPGVEPARTWLAERKILQITVTWKEDVRAWHPGQRWIWQAGGLGVFDSGINALSILTRIIPGALVLQSAELSYPSNCQTPIAARLVLADERGASARVEFDFLHAGPPAWSIEVDTDAGRLSLSRGGSDLTLNGAAAGVAQNTEYANVYARFAALLRDRNSDVDSAPLQLVADAFLCGRRVEVEPFKE
jgi:D-galactose 1-dehydrogenase